MKIKGLLFIAIALITTHCSNLNDFDQNISIDNSSWAIDKVLRFEYNSKDTLNGKDIFVNLRHTGLYKYNNIFLFVTTLAPNGESIKDTTEFILANNSGKWFGSGIGDISDVRLVYKHNVKFGQVGKYVFYVQHGMRDKKLDEIVDVGIHIQNSK